MRAPLGCSRGRVFVTGGTGFIGGRLLRLLSQQGIPATALVRNAGSALAPGSLLDIREGDLLDRESLSAAMAGCQYAIHLAAKISFDPRDAVALKRVNVEGTRSLLEAARQSGLSRVVVVSSASTVGISSSPTALLNEDTPFDTRLLAHNVYLASKKEMEELALAYSSPQMGVVVANPTTVFGPGDKALNSGSIVKTIAASRVVPVPPGGTSVVHVDDVAEALVAMLTRGTPGSRYIITGENLTFRKAFETVAGIVGRRPRFVHLPPPARLPMKLAARALHTALSAMGRPAWLITPQIVEDTFLYKYYDSRLATQDLGWRPRLSFAEAVAEAWRYYLAEGLIAQ